MRYLKRFSIVLFICAVLFYVYADIEYKSDINTDKPTIKNEIELLEVSVNDEPAALYKGLTASDETDGDLTDDIMIASTSHFFEDNTINVKYVVFDSSNNSASVTRKVRYVDYKSPEFTLSTPLVYSVGDSFDLLEKIKVNDCIDGEISDRVRVISNMVNNYAVGTYPIVLEVSNSCGDTSQITVWATYQNKDDTVSVKLHQYIIYLELGEKFEPYSWISSVTDKDNKELNKEKVEIKGTLDTSKEGNYQLVYSYNDGGNAGQVPVTVVVREGQK